VIDPTGNAFDTLLMKCRGCLLPGLTPVFKKTGDAEAAAGYAEF
jgi:hypothetical protein